MKTNELTGPALDWAVAKAEGFRYINASPAGGNTHGAAWAASVMVSQKKGSLWLFNPTESWGQAGPIIEREELSIRKVGVQTWGAWHGEGYKDETHAIGPTLLIAAMRCYCCAKLGDEIDIPQELQPCQQPNL